MEKTLGGDRLGAGKRMKIELHNYGRSTHDIGYLWRSTMAAGTLVPFMSEIALPGDTFDIDINCDVKTHPTVGPLFGSYKVQLDIFQCPIRLYQGQLHNNKLGIGLKMSTVKLPIIKIAPQTTEIAELDTIEDIDNYQINPSSILAYLGIRGIGMSVVGTGLAGGREFNGVSLLAYWDIYKNYYANKQEEVGMVVHNEAVKPDQDVTEVRIGLAILPQGSNPGAPQQLNQGTIITLEGITGSDMLDQIYIQLEAGGLPIGHRVPIRELGTVVLINAIEIQLYYNYTKWGNRMAINWDFITQSELQNDISIIEFPLENIDKIREEILAHSTNPAPFEINQQLYEPYELIFKVDAGDPKFRSILGSQEGLGIKTYNSDLLNNWLQTEWIDGVDGITAITAVDTSGGEFTIDTLNLARKVYDMLNRIAVSGGTYDDWLDAVYTHDRYTRCESPIYMGGLIKELVFQEVVSQSESQPTDQGGAQPLGTLAGRGLLAKKHKGGSVTIKVDEPSYILGIVSLTPRLDYSQGNTWDVHLKTMDDLHKPALDEIGFQELVTEQMAWWDTHEDALGNWVQKSAGKQPAWMNYMTNINRVRGNFAIENNEMFMVLNRRYEAEPNGVVGVKIKDLTTYIDPTKFNHIFAETSLDSQNFWTQISVDMKVRRKISAKIMPNL